MRWFPNGAFRTLFKNMKRNNGYFWILENGHLPEIKRWVIGYWDGDSFWYDGDKYSDSEFTEIDETQIVRL